MFDVPVLAIVYNRVTFTHDLFTVLHKVKPARLYVAADGPLENDRIDCQLCLETRCVFMPEWDCEMKTLFFDKHYGKSQMVVNAINWFFENEPEGIVLFDDTLPNLNFFTYCKELLDLYRDDTRIAHIGGCNIYKHNLWDKSYFFSAYPHTWGFATWRNRWEGFDLNMKDLESFDFNEISNKYSFKSKVFNFWQRRYHLLQKNNVDLWEYQYFFHLWKTGGLSVVPSVNLVNNRGFRPQKRRLRRLNRPVQPILPLQINTGIMQDEKYDRFAFRRYYRKDKLTLLSRWLNENFFID